MRGWEHFHILFVCSFAIVSVVFAALYFVGHAKHKLLLGAIVPGTLALLGLALSGFLLAIQAEPGVWLSSSLITGLLGSVVLTNSVSLAGCCKQLAQHFTIPQVQASAVLLTSVGLVYGWVYVTDQREAAMEISTQLKIVGDIPNAVGKELTIEATTDRGLAIKLYSKHLNEAQVEQVHLFEKEQTKESNLRLIRTGEVDVQTNCHGWVFTGGKAWISGEDVPNILRDNGYYEVADPQPYDIIIHKNESGQVTHTGLVKFVDKSGLILIESKWGGIGRFLHKPEDQYFGQIFSYYRTSRQNHLLQVRG